MWGETYAKEDKGVTACVAFTQQGMDVLNNVNCELVEYPFARVAEGQIKTKIKYPMGWSFVIFFAKLQSVSMKQLVFFSRIIGKFNKIFK